jgi:hypothetical protein
MSKHLDILSVKQRFAQVNPAQKQFSLNRAASQKQFPISNLS